MNYNRQLTAVIPDTSASLLLRIRDPNDANSWLTFERIYGAVVRRYCRNWNLQSADTDDVVQEVLKSVADSIGSFDYDPRKGQFRGWLGTITGNKIRRFLERKKRHQHISLNGDAVNFTPCTDPDNEWVAAFGEVILKEACSMVRVQFEHQTWQCFELTWLKRLSPEQTANRLGLRISSVYVNKSRVLKKLESVIRDLSEFPGSDQAGLDQQSLDQPSLAQPPRRHCPAPR